MSRSKHVNTKKGIKGSSNRPKKSFGKKGFRQSMGTASRKR